MAMIKRIGYGQVEPNHLSAQRTGQIYAQLPCDSAISTLENGQFVKYDYSTGKVNFTGVGEWMLVNNEVKIYAEGESYKDFALIKTNYNNGVMVPRVFKTNIGDIFTTNTLEKANGKGATYEGVELNKKDLLKVNAQGFLVKEDALISASTEKMLWEVVEVYTMPDGQPGIKIMRVK